jgi:hypothetical protein
VRQLPGDKPLDRFLITAPVLSVALARREAVVYGWEPPVLRNITAEYFARLRWRPPAGDPSRIDAGDPWFAAQLDDGWYDIDRGIRWMGRKAGVRLGGPRSPGSRLAVSGFCPAEQVRTQPLRVRFTVEDRPAGEILLRNGGEKFQAEFPLPPGVHGKPSVNVSVEVERTFKAPPDVRELGIVFGTFEIRD